MSDRIRFGGSALITIFSALMAYVLFSAGSPLLGALFVIATAMGVVALYLRFRRMR